MRWTRNGSPIPPPPAISAAGSTEADIEALQTAINETRVRVWRAQPAEFFHEAVIDADGTLAETTGQCKEGHGHRLQRRLGLSPVGGVAREHAGAVVSRQPERQSAVGGGRGGAVRSSAGAVSRRRGSSASRFAAIRISVKRAISIGGTRDGVRFVFGYDARANVIAAAEALPARGVDARLVRRPPYDGADRAARSRPNVKEATIVAREFQNLRLEAEAVAEFPYRPTACATTYRMVVVRKNISVEQGDQPAVRSNSLFLLSHQ